MAKKSILEPRNFYKPFEYPEAFDFYEMHEKMHWLPEEVPLHQDVLDWKHKLTEGERQLSTQLFRFFTQADVDVAGAYARKYIPMFPKPEIRMMLLSFAAREAIHIQAYSHLIETIGMPQDTYKQFLEYDAMKSKHEFFEETLADGDDKIAQQIATFSGLTEGMQLFSSFVMLLNFTRFNKMNGMGQMISWSIRDESVHVDGMTWLFKQFIREHKHIWNDKLKKSIYDTAEHMVHLEDVFIDLAYETGGQQELDDASVKHYIRYITDRRLIGLGMKGIFGVKRNPLPWVPEILNAPEHSNFFELRSTSYSKGAMKGSWSEVWG